METITRERDGLRAPTGGQARRGPYRADPRAATTPAPRQPAPARALHPTPTPARPTPVRSPSAPAAAKRPVRPVKPARGRETTIVRQAAVAAGPRIRFAVLVLALLGGGLICLLVINTTLGATSFRISQLQSKNASLTSQEQALQQQLAAERSPAQIARRAYQLGMRAEPNTNILDLRTHRLDKLPAQPDAVAPLGGPALPAGSRP
jgi:uncharacterized protein HemX